MLQVGNTAVSVPGNLGVFHYLTVLTLAVYGIDRERALAYAIVLYAVALLPRIALGPLIMTAGPHGEGLRAQGAGLRVQGSGVQGSGSPGIV